MVNWLIGMIVGIFIAGAFAVALRFRRGGGGMNVEISSQIEQMRKVGELVVFRMVNKEIVTAADHWLGEWGKRNLGWLISEKKMAMIFEFGIDFSFDLKSPDFKVDATSDGQCILRLPVCRFTTHIRSIKFYDEQESKLLPALVPHVLSKALGGRFDEEDRNRLLEEARGQADQLAHEMVDQLQSDVQDSARATLGALARGFGAEQTTIEFSEHQPVLAKIDPGDERNVPAAGESSAG
jgi:hypothetical protein